MQMDQLLREADLTLKDLDAIAYGRGPGSFTGVRIAAAVTQGSAYGAELPVVGVSTLAALAHQAFRITGERRLLPAFDARMKEVYWAAYEMKQNGSLVCVVDEQVVMPEQVELPVGDGWFGIGSGWSVYPEVLAARCGTTLSAVESTLLCRAYDVALLGVAGYLKGDLFPAEEALPIYLRDQVAKTIAERLAARQ